MRTRIIGCTLLVALLASGPIRAQDAEEKIKRLERQLQLLQQELQALKSELHVETSRVLTAEPPRIRAATLEVAPRDEPEPDPNQFRVYWRDGIRLDTADEKVQMRFGGRIMNDWAVVRADDSLVESLGALGAFVRDGTEFRRARIYASGVLADRFEFKAEYDFAEVLGNFRDVYVGIRGVPVLGTLRAGHFKEPFGLEELTSSNHITFLERSAGAAFTPVRNVGMAFNNVVAQGRVTYSAGMFRESTNGGQSVGSGGPNLTARITGLPLYGNGGRRLLHVGAAYSRQAAPIDVALFRSRPEAHLLPPFVFTPLLDVSSYDLLGLEAAAVAGPFSIQSEMMKSYVDSPSGQDPHFTGFYVLGSFFLTGEHRRYSQSKGAFDRVRPNRSFMDDGGAGAWEVAARYSQLDLNDGLIQGGEMKNFTLGLNWYVNPYARLMWNYVRSQVADTGDADIVQMRFKIDF